MKQFDNLVILLLQSIPPQRPAIKLDTVTGTKKQEHCQADTKTENTHRPKKDMKYTNKKIHSNQDMNNTSTIFYVLVALYILVRD